MDIRKNKEFLTVYEFADLVGVHHNTVRKSIKNGRISAFRIGASDRSSYRISIHEINRLAVKDLDGIVDKIIETRKKT